MGAGIVGCSAAAFLAEAGLDVVVWDRDGVAAGASGRNSGLIQHPLSGPLVGVFAEALALHREVIDLPDEPDGILSLGATSTDGLPAGVQPELVEDAASVEPVVRPGIPAVRLRTGWAVGPERVTRAWQARAQDAGARFTAGGDAPPAAEIVLRATGAWTEGITPLWGVTATIDVRSAHALEEAGATEAVGGTGGERFTLVADVMGSSASPERPDPGAVARRLAGRARPFVGDVQVGAARVCPRPLSPDGLPLAGRLDERTWVCAGHGSMGISTGPATARAIARAIVGEAPPPAELDPRRFAVSPSESTGTREP